MLVIGCDELRMGASPPISIVVGEDGVTGEGNTIGNAEKPFEKAAKDR